MPNGDEPIFQLGTHSGATRFIFTTMAALKVNGSKRRPLWLYEPTSVQETGALTVWFGEHRALWPSWREIAERDGIDAMSLEIARLWSLGGIEICSSVIIVPGVDPRDLSVVAKLVNRSSEVVQHRFKSVAHRAAFMRWYLADIQTRSVFVMSEGCLIGPSHLQGIMDEIASNGLTKPAAAKHRRVRSGRRRKGA